MLFSVAPVEAETSAESAQRHQPLEGYTHDLSETGLGLIVPSSQISDRLLTDEGGRLRIVLLNLPTGIVEIDATAVRSERLQEPVEGFWCKVSEKLKLTTTYCGLQRIAFQRLACKSKFAPEPY